jgi:hypothetical protein
MMVFENDGIGARLERARENIINLTSEISAFLPEVRNGIVAPDDVDRNAQAVQNVLQPSEPAIPSRLGALAGEIIYLMRSALDHLAWHLVIAAGCEPGPRTAFPVFALDPSRNEKSLATYQGCVEGMSDTAKSRMERLQPYRRHGRLKQNALWILDDMRSTDQRTGLTLRLNTYRQQQIPSFSADKTVKVSQFAHKEGKAGIGEVATAGMKREDEDTPYLCFARFGKLTEVSVVDGLWLLWHATNGICASFAGELTAPPSCDFQQVVQSTALGRREHRDR